MSEERYVSAMARSARLEIRITPELRERVQQRADELGQSLSTFVERALEKALESPADRREGLNTPTPASPRASQEPRRW